jgi:hypothetical protein
LKIRSIQIILNEEDNENASTSVIPSLRREDFARSLAITQRRAGRVFGPFTASGGRRDKFCLRRTESAGKMFSVRLQGSGVRRVMAGPSESSHRSPLTHWNLKLLLSFWQRRAVLARTAGLNSRAAKQLGRSEIPTASQELHVHHNRYPRERK